MKGDLSCPSTCCGKIYGINLTYVYAETKGNFKPVVVKQ